MSAPTVSTPVTMTETTTAWVTFAGVMAIIGGAANLIWGWQALIQNSINEAAAPFLGDLTVGPLEVWGWASIVWALVLFGGAWLMLSHHDLGRITGITLAAVSAVFWLFAMPTFPIFALAVIAIDVVVMYGLIVHWAKATS
jgi:hypothetical protein